MAATWPQPLVVGSPVTSGHQFRVVGLGLADDQRLAIDRGSTASQGQTVLFKNFIYLFSLAFYFLYT